MPFCGDGAFSWLGILVKVILIYVCCQIGSTSATAQRNTGSERSRSNPSNYKDAILVYPTGIRSERDLPVCPALIDEESKDTPFSTGFSNPLLTGNDMSKLQQPGSTRNPSDSSSKSKGEQTPSKYMSACNLIHKRYFHPQIIERLCRCPDRTECPMQWSQPPSYKDIVASSSSASDNQKTKDTKQGNAKQDISTTPSTKAANSNMDPYTTMISSRSQLKFCAEVPAYLPPCEKMAKPSKDSVSEDLASMVKTVKQTFLIPELLSIRVNCYCPPLYRGWSFLSKDEPLDHANGTAAATEMNYYYRCDKLRKCGTGQQCGTIRTDYHFSYYHCSCPKKHLCIPKVYPPVSTEDVLEEAEEALYSGQVAPAFCTPE